MQLYLIFIFKHSDPTQRDGGGGELTLYRQPINTKAYIFQNECYRFLPHVGDREMVMKYIFLEQSLFNSNPNIPQMITFTDNEQTLCQRLQTCALRHMHLKSYHDVRDENMTARLPWRQKQRHQLLTLNTN